MSFQVKMILDAQWCRGLLKGDVIKEINRQNVQTLSHAQVVDILKDLPVGSEVHVLVLRGGERERGMVGGDGAFITVNILGFRGAARLNCTLPH